MAREAKKDPSELTVEEKLKALYQLQTMVSEIDKIKTLRGELPLEVQDLEDEVAGLSTRIEKIKAEIRRAEIKYCHKKIEIEAAKNSVEKYKSQQDNVRNNREYDVLTKKLNSSHWKLNSAKSVLKNIQLPKRPRMRKSHKAMKLWKKKERLGCEKG